MSKSKSNKNYDIEFIIKLFVKVICYFGNSSELSNSIDSFRKKKQTRLIHVNYNLMM